MDPPAPQNRLIIKDGGFPPIAMPPSPSPQPASCQAPYMQTARLACQTHIAPQRDKRIQRVSLIASPVSHGLVDLYGMDKLLRMQWWSQWWV